MRTIILKIRSSKYPIIYSTPYMSQSFITEFSFIQNSSKNFITYSTQH